MSKVVALMSMSLDGFVADPDDGVDEVFAWYFAGAERGAPAGVAGRNRRDAHRQAHF